MMPRALRLALAASLLMGNALASASLALAQGPADAGQVLPAGDGGHAEGEVDAGAVPASGAVAEADAGAGLGVSRTCVEHVPEGASRPVVKEEFPKRGTSGYTTELRLAVTHGRGETVLPEGFKLQTSSDGAKALEQAGFVIPDLGGSVKPTLKVEASQGGNATTTVTIPLVPLPPKPGRNLLVLPPLPIAVARANNDFLVLCTEPHPVMVEDPIANELSPQVKPNPPPRPQRVDWPLARNLAVGTLLGAMLCLCAVLLYRWWQRRPKVVKAPPRVPPWVTAIEELQQIRRSDLLADQRTNEYFDRVCDCIRKYLGDRYGFETLEQNYHGLETTTAEMLGLLERVRPPIEELPRIRVFLEECDLVKFARMLPDERACVEAFDRGENIVRRTIPVPGAVRLASTPDDQIPRPPSSSESLESST